MNTEELRYYRYNFKIICRLYYLQIILKGLTNKLYKLKIIKKNHPYLEKQFVRFPLKHYTTYYLLLTTCYLLLATYYRLLTTYYLLLPTFFVCSATHFVVTDFGLISGRFSALYHIDCALSPSALDTANSTV